MGSNRIKTKRAAVSKTVDHIGRQNFVVVDRT